MKYFEDEKLTKLTSELTGATLGRSRFIHGRIEAYTMKRAGTDKKYAHALGERYVAEMKTVESQLAEYKCFMERLKKLEEDQDAKKVLLKTAAGGGMRRSSGGGSSSSSGKDFDSATKACSNPRKTPIDSPIRRKRSFSTGTQLEATTPSSKRQKQKDIINSRRRSSSFDVCNLSVGSHDTATADNTTAGNNHNNSKSAVVPFAKFGKGQFGEMGARRLMTDLILTLNSSFPDYDFANVRPADFEKIPVGDAVKQINERLSGLAVEKMSFLPDMWNALDGVVRLADCEVYSYVPKTRDEDDDPLSFLTQTLIDDHHAAEGDHQMAMDSGESQSTSATCTVLWSFNYFFVSKALKRIVFFPCVESMKSEETSQSLDDDDDVSFVRFHGTEASDVDFDLDPSGNVAGGIPISSAM